MSCVKDFQEKSGHAAAKLHVPTTGGQNVPFCTQCGSPMPRGECPQKHAQVPPAVVMAAMAQQTEEQSAQRLQAALGSPEVKAALPQGLAGQDQVMVTSKGGSIPGVKPQDMWVYSRKGTTFTNVQIPPSGKPKVWSWNEPGEEEAVKMFDHFVKSSQGGKATFHCPQCGRFMSGPGGPCGHCFPGAVEAPTGAGVGVTAGPPIAVVPGPAKGKGKAAGAVSAGAPLVPPAAVDLARKTVAREEAKRAAAALKELTGQAFVVTPKPSVSTVAGKKKTEWALMITSAQDATKGEGPHYPDFTPAEVQALGGLNLDPGTSAYTLIPPSLRASYLDGWEQAVAAKKNPYPADWPPSVVAVLKKSGISAVQAQELLTEHAQVWQYLPRCPYCKHWVSARTGVCRYKYCPGYHHQVLPATGWTWPPMRPSLVGALKKFGTDWQTWQDRITGFAPGEYDWSTPEAALASYHRMVAEVAGLVEVARAGGWLKPEEPGYDVGGWKEIARRCRLAIAQADDHTLRMLAYRQGFRFPTLIQEHPNQESALVFWLNPAYRPSTARLVQAKALQRWESLSAEQQQEVLAKEGALFGQVEAQASPHWVMVAPPPPDKYQQQIMASPELARQDVLARAEVAKEALAAVQEGTMSGVVAARQYVLPTWRRFARVVQEHPELGQTMEMQSVGDMCRQALLQLSPQERDQAWAGMLDRASRDFLLAEPATAEDLLASSWQPGSDPRAEFSRLAHGGMAGRRALQAVEKLAGAHLDKKQEWSAAELAALAQAGRELSLARSVEGEPTVMTAALSWVGKYRATAQMYYDALWQQAVVPLAQLRDVAKGSGMPYAGQARKEEIRAWFRAQGKGTPSQVVTQVERRLARQAAEYLVRQVGRKKEGQQVLSSSGGVATLTVQKGNMLDEYRSAAGGGYQAQFTTYASEEEAAAALQARAAQGQQHCPTCGRFVSTPGQACGYCSLQQAAAPAPVAAAPEVPAPGPTPPTPVAPSTPAPPLSAVEQQVQAHLSDPTLHLKDTVFNEVAVVYGGKGKGELGVYRKSRLWVISRKGHVVRYTFREPNGTVKSYVTHSSDSAAQKTMQQLLQEAQEHGAQFHCPNCGRFVSPGAVCDKCSLAATTPMAQAIVGTHTLLAGATPAAPAPGPAPATPSAVGPAAAPAALGMFAQSGVFFPEHGPWRDEAKSAHGQALFEHLAASIKSHVGAGSRVIGQPVLLMGPSSGKATTGKVWAGAAVEDAQGKAHFISVWGPANSPNQASVNSLATAWQAEAVLMDKQQEKLAKGYMPPSQVSHQRCHNCGQFLSKTGQCINCHVFAGSTPPAPQPAPAAPVAAAVPTPPPAPQPAPAAPVAAAVPTPPPAPQPAPAAPVAAAAAAGERRPRPVEAAIGTAAALAPKTGGAYGRKVAGVLAMLKAKAGAAAAAAGAAVAAVESALGLTPKLPRMAALPPVTRVGRAQVGGTHEKDLYLDESGRQWLFKPDKKMNGARPHIEVAAARIADRLGVTTPQVFLFTDSKGHQGSMQLLVEGCKVGGTHIGDYTPAQQAQIAQAHVLRWLVSEHDGKGDNHLVTPDGDVVVVDLGQAFRYFGADELSMDYAPNAGGGFAPPLHNALWHGVASGKIKMDVREALLPTIQAVEAIPDAEYRAMLQPYAEQAAQQDPSYVSWIGPMRKAAGKRLGKPAVTTPEIAQEFLDQAVARKHRIRQDFEHFLTGVTGTSFVFEPAGPSAPKKAPQPSFAAAAPSPA